LDTGGDIFELFADDAQVFFPKCPLANGTDEIKQLFGNVAAIVSAVTHDYAYLNYLHSGDTVVVEGTSSGRAADGTEWRAGVTHAGRWCDVFEIRDHKIRRLFVYLDPDYADADTARYPWLAQA
ncbi:MAG: nuclear transport factor 2 family protein, partial [Pseudonocardia sp.]|nr:nuclear transport factor 2 family protein [Pseudonocardia sp.]